MNKSEKILVSSVTAWNSGVGSNTLSSWFSIYDKENLANLYIREENPDSEVCNKYFKISETQILKSIFNRKTITGKICEMSVSENTNLKFHKRRYRLFKKMRLWIFLYIRELIWILGKWKSKELDSFINEFAPTVIVFPLESLMHFNAINRYIVKKTGAKAIGIFWDDNFTYKPHKWSLGFRIHRYFLKVDLNKSVKLCSDFFAISSQMKIECDKTFGINSVVLTKSVIQTKSVVKSPVEEGILENDNPIKMIYTGNLLIGRNDTLKLLIDAINRINKSCVKIILEIYTNTDLTKKYIKRITETPGVYLKDAVTQNVVFDLQKNADVLVFLEALKGSNKESARLSFSTKLTDYFSAGKCIFAIGPQSIAPIKYLKEENVAIIASSYDEIEQELLKMLSDRNIVSRYGVLGYECGIRNHSETQIHETLKHTIDKLYN